MPSETKGLVELQRDILRLCACEPSAATLWFELALTGALCCCSVRSQRHAAACYGAEAAEGLQVGMLRHIASYL
jgi:hypothetical protein